MDLGKGFKMRRSLLDGGVDEHENGSSKICGPLRHAPTYLFLSTRPAGKINVWRYIVCLTLKPGGFAPSFLAFQ